MKIRKRVSPIQIRAVCETFMYFFLMTHLLIRPRQTLFLRARYFGHTILLARLFEVRQKTGAQNQSGFPIKKQLKTLFFDFYYLSKTFGFQMCKHQNITSTLTLVFMKAFGIQCNFFMVYLITICISNGFIF